MTLPLLRRVFAQIDECLESSTLVLKCDTKKEKSFKVFRGLISRLKFNTGSLELWLVADRLLHVTFNMHVLNVKK